MIKLKILAWCNGLKYFIFYLYYGTNTYVAAVVYLAYEDVVLVHGCVGVFVLVSIVKLSFRSCWFWYLHLCNTLTLDYIFFNFYTYITIQHLSVSDVKFTNTRN